MTNFPSIRQTAKNPKFILNSAQQNIRSNQKKIYIFVEGLKDARFFKNIGINQNSIKYDGFDGKKLVRDLLIMAKKPPYTIFDKCFFIMDIDYDIPRNSTLYEDNNVFYHGYCNINKNFFYNDLEVFLLQTDALQKLFNEYDIEENVEIFRTNLFNLASDIGFYKLADEILIQEHGLSVSILDGLSIENFIKINNFIFEENDFIDNLKVRSPRKEYINDLVEKSHELKTEISNQKVIIKGHDLTKIIEIYLKSKGKHWANQNSIEMALRVGCEKNEFYSSELGESFLSRECIKSISVEV